MMHKCINKSAGNVYHLEQMVSDFFPYSEEKLGFDQPVAIIFQGDKDNAMKMLGKTAYYDPTSFEIILYVDGRHPKDVLRSLSHELVHHAQNCRGDFKTSSETDVGYAQKDPHLRSMEREAYTKGNLIFRDFEDLIKTGKILVDIDFKKSGEPKMALHDWKNKELNGLLMEKWGLSKKNEGLADEFAAQEAAAAATGPRGTTADPIVPRHQRRKVDVTGPTASRRVLPTPEEAAETPEQLVSRMKSGKDFTPPGGGPVGISGDIKIPSMDTISATEDPEEVRAQEVEPGDLEQGHMPLQKAGEKAEREAASSSRGTVRRGQGRRDDSYIKKRMTRLREAYGSGRLQEIDYTRADAPDPDVPDPDAPVVGRIDQTGLSADELDDPRSMVVSPEKLAAAQGEIEDPDPDETWQGRLRVGDRQWADAHGWADLNDAELQQKFDFPSDPGPVTDYTRSDAPDPDRGPVTDYTRSDAPDPDVTPELSADQLDKIIFDDKPAQLEPRLYNEEEAPSRADRLLPHPVTDSGVGKWVADKWGKFTGHDWKPGVSTGPPLAPGRGAPPPADYVGGMPPQPPLEGTEAEGEEGISPAELELMQYMANQEKLGGGARGEATPKDQQFYSGDKAEKAKAQEVQPNIDRDSHMMELPRGDRRLAPGDPLKGISSDAPPRPEDLLDLEEQAQDSSAHEQFTDNYTKNWNMFLEQTPMVDPKLVKAPSPAPRATDAQAPPSEERETGTPPIYARTDDGKKPRPKISVREAREITRRIIERVKKERG